MLIEKYQNTPVFGFIPKEKTRFVDRELFGDDLWKYVILKKIKLWYGTPKSGDDNIKDKIILGIQCVYQDTVTGTKTTTEQHCGDLSSDDIETNEHELKENDFFTKFNIDFDTAITHLKFTTKNGESLEFGKEKEDTKRTVTFNTDKEPHMIHSFVGIFNIYGLRALGCRHIYKKDFLLIHLMGILRLRHIFKIDEDEKKKWIAPETLNKLPLEMRAIAKLCALPDATFAVVMKFCA
jgi:hypothetical protein